MTIVIRVNPRAGIEIGEALGDYFADRLGPAIQANARRTVPVRTGALSRSIIVQVRRDGAKSVLQVGSALPYALFVETGTSRMAAQPYLRPALLQARGTA